VVRHGEVKAEQGNNGADQPLGLPQCRADTDFSVSAVAIAIAIADIAALRRTWFAARSSRPRLLRR
jgi:hypothetical protein